MREGERGGGRTRRGSAREQARDDESASSCARMCEEEREMGETERRSVRFGDRFGRDERAYRP